MSKTNARTTKRTTYGGYDKASVKEGWNERNRSQDDECIKLDDEQIQNHLKLMAESYKCALSDITMMPVPLPDPEHPQFYTHMHIEFYMKQYDRETQAQIGTRRIFTIKAEVKERDRPIMEAMRKKLLAAKVAREQKEAAKLAAQAPAQPVQQPAPPTARARSVVSRRKVVTDVV